jgi:hypothetical protein
LSRQREPGAALTAVRTLTWLAVALMLAGLATASLQQAERLEARSGPLLGLIVSDAARAARMHPDALANVGLLVLLAVPLVRTAVTALAASRRADWTMTLINALVLLVVTAGIFQQ